MTATVRKPGQSGSCLEESWNAVSEDSEKEIERGPSADSFRPEPLTRRGRMEWASEAKRVGKVVLIGNRHDGKRGKRSKPQHTGEAVPDERAHCPSAEWKASRSASGAAAD